MGIRKAECSHALKARELSRLFVSVEPGKFSDTHWKLTITVRPREVKFEMMGTSHRTEHESFFIDLYRRVHRVFIVGVVSGFFVEFYLCDVGSVHMEISAPDFFVHDKAFKFSPYDGPIVRKKGEPLSDCFGEDEKVELFPELLMVAFFRFFLPY